MRFPTLCSLLLPLSMVAACSSSTESTKGQMITCDTDPGTGVILACQPGGGGGPNTCVDVDEDGDGECSDHDDDGTTARRGVSVPHDGDGDEDADSDDDGVPDSEDCDEHPGEDGDDDGGVDLPYDIKMSLGATYSPIADAFAEKGAQPAAVISVTGGSWRITELQAGTPFQIGPDDCNHAGNRDVGRDRVVVTWENADGSRDSDHLDLRYCD